MSCLCVHANPASSLLNDGFNSRAGLAILTAYASLQCLLLAIEGDDSKLLTAKKLVFQQFLPDQKTS